MDPEGLPHHLRLQATGVRTDALNTEELPRISLSMSRELASPEPLGRRRMTPSFCVLRFLTSTAWAVGLGGSPGANNAETGDPFQGRDDLFTDPRGRPPREQARYGSVGKLQGVLTLLSRGFRIQDL